MRPSLLLPALCAAALAACTASGGSPTAATSAATTAAAFAPAPAASARAPFVGTWVGELSPDTPVRVVVPETGEAYYTFRGRRVPTIATSVRGDTLSMPFRGGGGVTLTRDGDRMIYRYVGQNGRAQTVMRRG